MNECETSSTVGTLWWSIKVTEKKNIAFPSASQVLASDIPHATISSRKEGKKMSRAEVYRENGAIICWHNLKIF